LIKSEIIKDIRIKLQRMIRTISDLSFDLFKYLIPPNPIAKPKVWHVAKIYPVDEPSSMGKTSCEPYITKTDISGTIKKPRSAPNPNMKTSLVTCYTNKVMRSKYIMKEPKDPI
jgi:hypothetical protein